MEQLFMVPAFREAICSADPAPSETSLPQDPAQWVGRRLLMHFENAAASQVGCCCRCHRC
jgi:hypothetical protein